MWVTRDCRDHNIGPELVRAVLAWAESHGASSIGLWVNAANRPAISLYEKAGSAVPVTAWRIAAVLTVGQGASYLRTR